MKFASCNMSRMMGAVILAGWLGGLVAAQGQSYLYTQSFETFTNDHPIVIQGDWAAGDGDLSRVIVSNITGYTGAYPIADTNHTKVLQLNTEGTILTNTVTAMANGAHTNLYLDSLVYLVASETEPAQEILGNTDNKVAIYLNSESNLVVYHGGSDGTFTSTVFTAETIVPETWVRLTIPMDMEAALGGFDDPIPFFQILVNGTTLTKASEGFVTPSGDPLDYGSGEGEWFRFMNYSSQLGTETEQKVTALAFSGTGMIDDLVLTSDNPIDPGAFASDGKTPLSWIDDNFGGTEPDPGDLVIDLYQGYLANVNPENAFAIIEVGIDGNDKPYVKWTAFGEPNGNLIVESKTDLTSATWTALNGTSVFAAGVLTWTADDVAPAGPLFIRARVTE